LEVRSTSIFRASLHDLCRQAKHQYFSCPSDICWELFEKSVDDLLTTNNAILHDDGIKCIVKIRIACSSRKVGKSGGFRLIVTADRSLQQLVFLDIYPKTGPRSKSNISNDDLKFLLKQYLNERDKNELRQHDLENVLAVLETES
jgi:hypothetical protein